MDTIANLIFTLFLLVVTYATGSIIEKKHYKKIKRREIVLIRNPIVSFGAKKWTTNKPIKSIEFVSGEAVIAGDYFKNFIAGIKNFFGGRLTPFEAIMDRARREAILRMREKAINANIIVNTRIETIMLNHTGRKNSVPKCAIIAYGTAVTYE